MPLKVLAMKLSKIKIGQHISLYKQICNIPNLSKEQVSGINRAKEFFEPTIQIGNDTSKYKVVPQNYFACNLMHVGRDIVLPIAMNRTNKDKYVSPAYTVFSLNDESVILRQYLFMLVNSNEKDRFFWFHCDSSIRDGMDWNVFCEIELSVPHIKIQKKYVAIYEGLLNNLKCYQNSLEDLKLVCDGYIEDLRKKYSVEKIGKYIKRYNNKNIDNKCSKVMGISVNKCFREPTSKVNRNELQNYKIVKPKQIAFVQTTHNEKVFACALNNTNEDLLVSSVNEVFYTDEKKLLSEYLFLFFLRKEFDRYARFHSWGTVRELFVWEDLCNVKIPIPSIKIQQSIVNIFDAYNKRKEIVEKLKLQIKNICPILIKGSLEEAKTS